MANVTIGDLTLVTSAAAGDLIEIQTAGGLSRSIAKSNYIGATLTGGGTLATGGFTLTVPATGTAALKSGTPTAGNLSKWSDANTLINSTLTEAAVSAHLAASNGVHGVTGNVVGTNDTQSLDGKTIRTGGMAIADDNVAVIALPKAIGTLIIWEVNENSSNGMWFYRAAGPSPAAFMSQAAAGAQTASTTGVLTGTTGTDGKLTVSVDNVGNLYIENRRGGSRTISYMIMG